jgi:hypothetical protein
MQVIIEVGDVYGVYVTAVVSLGVLKAAAEILPVDHGGDSYGFFGRIFELENLQDYGQVGGFVIVGNERGHGGPLKGYRKKFVFELIVGGGVEAVPREIAFRCIEGFDPSVFERDIGIGLKNSSSRFMRC